MSTPSNVNDELTNAALHGNQVANTYLIDPDTGQPYDSNHPVPISGSVTPPANQRVDAQSGDFVDGAITTLGQASDSNSTNTAMGRLTKLRDIFLDMWDSTNHWLQVKVMNANANGQVTSANSAPVVIASDQSKLPTKAASGDFADGAITTLGLQADAAVVGDNAGTVNAHARGLTKMVNDVWDSTNHLFNINVSDRWARQAGQVDIARILGAAMSPSNPNITEAAIENAIRNGQGYVATTGSLVTATNANVVPCLMSIFNPSGSGKTIVIYRLRISQLHSSSTSNIQYNTVDPSGTTNITKVITPQNAKLGGAASVASISSSATGITTSPTQTGTLLEEFSYPSALFSLELLQGGNVYTLPSGSATGIAVFSTATTAGDNFIATGWWVEL